MILSKKDLLEKLKKAMPGIEAGNVVLQGADSFVFENGCIYSYNDSIAVMIPFKGSEEMKGAVKAKEFYQTISKLPQDEITLAVNEKSWLIKCGKVKVEFTLQNFDYKSRLDGITPDEKWIDLDDSFINALGVCKMPINKTILSGVYFNSDVVLSTDAFQINQFKFDKLKFPKFWISDNSADELLKFSKFKQLQVNGNWVHFKFEDGTIFSVKTLMVDKFPEAKILSVMSVNKEDNNCFHAVFPKALFPAIDRAVEFGIEIEGHNSVRLVLDPKHIEVSAERASGKYNEKVQWENTMPEFEPITVYVDSQMMAFMSKRTLEFYILHRKTKKGVDEPTLLFVTSNSRHLMTTLMKG